MMAPRSRDGDGDMHYLGVRKRQLGRYSAEIRDPIKKQRICLGVFDSEEAAARAYDNAARRYRGPNAITNFPLLDLNVQIKSLNELLFNNETPRQSAALQCSSNPTTTAVGSYPKQLSLFGRSFRTMPTTQTHMLHLRPESYQEIADELNIMRGFPVNGISKGINVDLNLPPPPNL